MEVLCTIDVEAGFQERSIYLLVTLIELSIANFCKKNTSKYKEYLSLEYPRLGEMYSYNGYLDYLRLS
jgi:hypothetical protein